MQNRSDGDSRDLGPLQTMSLLRLLDFLARILWVSYTVGHCRLGSLSHCGLISDLNSGVGAREPNFKNK